MAFNGLFLDLASNPLLFEPTLEIPDPIEILLLNATETFGLAGSGLAVSLGDLKKPSEFFVLGTKLEQHQELSSKSCSDNHLFPDYNSGILKTSLPGANLIKLFWSRVATLPVGQKH